MGLVRFTGELVKYPKPYFISDIDGKAYRTFEDRAIRLDYLEDMIKTRTLQLGVPEISHDSKDSGKVEKISNEAGYSLDFSRIIVDRYRNTKHIRSEVVKCDEMFGDATPLQSFVFSKYYAEILNQMIGKGGRKKTTVISGPPRCGVSFEMSVIHHLEKRYSEFDGFDSRYYPFHALDEFNKEMNEKDKKNRYVFEVSTDNPSKRSDYVLVDDCLVTGTSIRREIKSMSENVGRKICPKLVLVGVDCGLRGKSGKKVSKELEKEYNTKVESIVDIEEAFVHFRDHMIMDARYPVRKTYFKYMPGVFGNLQHGNSLRVERDFMLNLIDTIGKNASCSDGSVGLSIDVDIARFNEEAYHPFLDFMKTQHENYDRPLSEIPKLMKRNVA